MVIAMVEWATRYGGAAHCQAVVAACDGGIENTPSLVVSPASDQLIGSCWDRLLLGIDSC
jgi:hypothetical protein